MKPPVGWIRNDAYFSTKSSGLIEADRLSKLRELGRAGAALHDRRNHPASFVSALEAVELIQRRSASSRRDGCMCRALHSKPLNAARGWLIVREDVPAHLRVGIAARSGHYKAVVRFSTGHPRQQPDWAPNVRGMAVRVFGVAGDPLDRDYPDTQDFLAANGDIRLPASVDHFAQLMAALNSMATLPLRVPRILPIGAAIRLGWDIAGPAARTFRDLGGQRFHGIGTIAFGATPVRFSLEPCQSAAWNWRPWRSDGLRMLLDKRLENEELAWTLMAQCFVDEASTPVDDLSVRWDRRVAPAVPIAKLVLTRRRSDAAADIMRVVEPMAFSPWRGKAVHRPLGPLQELRRAAYDESAYRRRTQHAAASAPSRSCGRQLEEARS